MKISKSERIKKIIQTDDKNLFYTKPNILLDYPNTQIINNNNNNESLQKSNNEQLNIQKQTSIEFKIGNYLILQTIGEGTFGKVKLGIYLPKNEKVAIKILEKDRIRDNDDYIRIKREFDMLSKINHPNVILVTEIFESIDRYYSVMEYCEGGELFHYILKKKDYQKMRHLFYFFK
jgi:5'-AMP-activated protein kinase catalytic alpha subunit